MEPKKTPKADLRGKSFLFFNVGLITALLLAIFAFSFKTADETGTIDLDHGNGIVDEIINVPATSINTPPPPPRVVVPKFIEVKKEEIEDDLPIDIDLEDDPIEDVQTTPVVVIEQPEVPTDEPFIWLEQGAAPEGGLPAFYKFIGKQMKYPAQARRLEIEGKVFVEFIVERDGTLTILGVINGIGAGCDEEALRVLRLSPKWNPGKQRGKPVRQKMIIPIHFQLQR